METKLIKKDLTRIKLNNKTEKFLIDKLKFIGAVPTKESRVYTYFLFRGDIAKTLKYLGLK